MTPPRVTEVDSWRENVEAVRETFVRLQPFVGNEHRVSAFESGWAAVAALTAQMEEQARRLSCGFDTGQGQNCGKCHDCLKVNWHFGQQAIENLKAQMEEMEAALHAQATQTLCANEGWTNQKARVEELERERNLDGQAAADYERQATMEFKRAERYERALREIAAYRLRPVDHPTLAYAEVCEIARAALASDEAGRPEGREGMVTVYDHNDRYLGCMGRETWEKALADEAGSA